MQRHNEDFDQVSGIFDSERALVDVVDSLRSRGYQEDDLSVLMSERTRDHYFSAKEDTKLPEGTAVGGISGGVIGAIIGGLTLVGNVLAPGVGLLVAGPIVGALTGGLIGVAAGGLIGALVGVGIPEHEAKFYETALKEEGNILLVAHVPRSESAEVKALFERYGAKNLKIYH